MLLNTAVRNGCTQKDLPENIIIISDMEFDRATDKNNDYWYDTRKGR